MLFFYVLDPYQLFGPLSSRLSSTGICFSGVARVWGYRVGTGDRGNRSPQRGPGVEPRWWSRAEAGLYRHRLHLTDAFSKYMYV